MPRFRQTFENRTKQPLFVYVEMNPDCYKLQPGDKLTIVEEVPEGCNFPEVAIHEDELTIHPVNTVNTTEALGNAWAEPEILVNGQSAEGLSWNWLSKEGSS